MKNGIKKILNKISDKSNLVNEIARSKAIGMSEQELSEMEHTFAILVFGMFVGLPSPPMQITLDLLPESEKELTMLLQKVDTAHEPLSVLASLFQID